MSDRTEIRIRVEAYQERITLTNLEGWKYAGALRASRPRKPFVGRLLGLVPRRSPAHSARPRRIPARGA